MRLSELLRRRPGPAADAAKADGPSLAAAAERADYFQAMSRRAIETAAELLGSGSIGSLPAGPASNPCGDDLKPELLVLIENVVTGRETSLPPWREAQIRELGFWRWTAFHGYGGRDPRLFPLHSEHLMVSTFYRTGWAMAEFRDAAAFELGCGPFGMIAYIPARYRLGFDPLNPEYDRLFAKSRSREIDYASDIDAFRQDPRRFDLGICHNVLDHTDDAAAWFDLFFEKMRMGARFIFQVNLSKLGFEQSDEHRRMHPSPLAHEQISEWLAAKSDRFDSFVSSEPSSENEFYFLGWGSKTSDTPVTYRNLFA